MAALSGHYRPFSRQAFRRGYLLPFLFLSACGNLPDLKVTVARIPAADQALSVIVWSNQADPAPSKEPLILELPPPPTTEATRSYDFGLRLGDGRDGTYLISIGAFVQKGTQLCLHVASSTVEVGPFNSLSSITAVMPITADTTGTNVPAGGCYERDLLTSAEVLPPRITAATSVLKRDISSGTQQSPMQFFIDGWAFQPKAAMKLQLGIAAPVTPSPILMENAYRIQTSLPGIKPMDLFSASQVTLTVTNPDGQSVTQSTQFSP